MKEIQNNNKTIIVVNVPEEISKFWIHFESLSGETRVAQNTNGLTTWDLCLEKGLHIDKYKILGKLSELSEEDCKPFIEFKEIQILDWKTGHNGFKDYKKSTNSNDYFTLGLPKESLISLLQSNGVNTSNLNTLLILEKI